MPERRPRNASDPASAQVTGEASGAGDGGTVSPARVVDGWFTVDPPRLIGTRCTACGTVCFPPQTLTCRNPACENDELVEERLSNRGRIWSYADARYRPPPPYVSGEEFEPYAVAAVELPSERLVVLGQVVRGVGVDDLHVGMEVELVVEHLDPGHVVWKWRPLAGEGGAPPAGAGPGRSDHRQDGA
ncbi:MAG: benzoylsuccinyl-CoA thiolase [Actinoallomurus sp.]|nr:benzoylsuccinyl-CoA thiolase [Actinoallomurus sp.]